jgi:hypothetical protein
MQMIRQFKRIAATVCPLTGTARHAVSAGCSGATIPPDARAGTLQLDVPGGFKQPHAVQGRAPRSARVSLNYSPERRARSDAPYHPSQGFNAPRTSRRARSLEAPWPLAFQPCLAALALLLVVVTARAATISEDFSSDPLVRGWRIFGDASLFHWNPTNQNLEVTWDSSRTNSYFYLPLGTIVSKADDFSIRFDLRMHDIAIGTTASKPDTFEIAVGLLNSVNATKTNYFRGTGVNGTYGVRNTVEFDYFPPTALIEPTFAPTVISSNNAITFSDNRLEMTTDDLFRITMTFTASNQMLRTSLTRNGLPFGSPPNNTLRDLPLAAQPDFRVNWLGIINYSDALQFGSTQYWGSILAHGIVDNFALTVPDPPVSNLAGAQSNSTFRVTFATSTNWWYALERSVDLATWSVVSPTNRGNGMLLSWQDSNAPMVGAFYRVKALRP